MPNSITVTPAEVRGAIATEGNASTLPDSIINLNIYSGRAIREVKERDPEYASRSGDDAARLNTAADLITASLLVLAYPHVVEVRSSNGPGFGFKRVPPEELAAELRARAEAELNAVLNSDSQTSSMPVMFTLAQGRRGI